MTAASVLARRLRPVPRTVGALVLLQAALPANLALTGAALLRTALRPPPAPAVAERPRTVLVSGGKMTKALQLARSFHAAGHRVLLAESAKYRFTGHRFSRAVAGFHVLPAPGAPDYVDALVELVRREGVDVYVPVCSPAASRYDALARAALAPYCEVVHGDPDQVREVDDKDLFAAAAERLGLPVPRTRRVESAADVERFDFAGGPYIMKSIRYDPVNRLDLTPLPLPTAEATAAFARSKPISPDNPWILQEFAPGTEFCTHGTVRDGRLQVWACCESSASQLNYAMADKPAIEEWVTRFVGELGLTGQYSFDFIEDPDGTVRAIECNPRTHSAITMFYDHPGLAAAYLETGGPVVRPTAASRPTYWLYNELWRALRHPGQAGRTLAVLREGKDAVFDWADPLPFLLLHHLQIPWLLAVNLVRLKDWVKIDFNIGKLVEPGGD